MNNNTHDRKIQVKNHKRFQCVYTQVIAQYGFAANYVLDYLFRQGKPVRFSSRRFSQFFRYACEDTYLDVVNKLQADGLLYRVVECKWDRCLKQPRLQALYGLTEKGRDFIAAEKQARRFTAVAYADLIVFNYRVDRAYHYTLLRTNTPTEFQLTLKELSAIMNTSVQTTRTFMRYMIDNKLLIIKERSRPGLSAVYCHVIVDGPVTPSPRVIYKNNKEVIVDDKRSFSFSKENQLFCKAIIEQLNSTAVMQREEFKALSHLLHLLKRKLSGGLSFVSKSLWNNVIMLGLFQAEKEGFTREEYFKACVAAKYSNEHRKKTIDLYDVIHILRANRKIMNRTSMTSKKSVMHLAPSQFYNKCADQIALEYAEEVYKNFFHSREHVEDRKHVSALACSLFHYSEATCEIVQNIALRDPKSFYYAKFYTENADAITHLNDLKSSAKTVLYSDLCVKYGKDTARRLAFIVEFKSMILFKQKEQAVNTIEQHLRDRAERYSYCTKAVEQAKMPAFEAETEESIREREQHLKDLRERMQYCDQAHAPLSKKKTEQGALSADDLFKSLLEQFENPKVRLTKRKA